MKIEKIRKEKEGTYLFCRFKLVSPDANRKERKKEKKKKEYDRKTF